MPRPLLEVEMLKKCTLLLREPHFQVKALKNTTCSDHSSKLRRSKSARRFGAKHISKLRLGPLLDIQMSFRVPGARDCAPCSEENVRVLSVFQNDGKHGTFEKDSQRCISRGRRSARDMFTRDVRRSGR